MPAAIICAEFTAQRSDRAAAEKLAASAHCPLEHLIVEWTPGEILPTATIRSIISAAGLPATVEESSAGLILDVDGEESSSWGWDDPADVIACIRRFLPEEPSL